MAAIEFPQLDKALLSVNSFPVLRHAGSAADRPDIPIKLTKQTDPIFLLSSQSR